MTVYFVRVDEYTTLHARFGARAISENTLPIPLLHTLLTVPPQLNPSCTWWHAVWKYLFTGYSYVTYANQVQSYNHALYCTRHDLSTTVLGALFGQ